jgi:hypothetical protein
LSGIVRSNKPDFRAGVKYPLGDWREGGTMVKLSQPSPGRCEARCHWEMSAYKLIAAVVSSNVFFHICTVAPVISEKRSFGKVASVLPPVYN